MIVGTHFLLFGEVVVVNEARHDDAFFLEAAGRDVICAMAVLVLEVKVRAVIVEAPSSIGGSAALAHAINPCRPRGQVTF
jgi:hypothetical protein